MADKTDTLSKALPESVRRHNKAVLLKLLYPDVSLTRADLARASSLTRMAVSDIVSELLGEDLLMEVGLSHTAGPGKRGRLLRINPEGRSVVALDLSTPYVFRGAVMNLLGQVTAREEIPLTTQEKVPVELVGELCTSLIDRAGSPVLGVGVTSPGIVSQAGVVDDATNLGWVQMDLRGYLAGLTGLDVYVNNDANNEVLAERHFGSGERDLLMIHLGDGVGAGVLVAGKLVTGRNRAAGEIGHVVVDEDGPLCRCGKRGCLEAMISVPKLTAMMDKDPAAISDILKEAGRMLGRVLALSVSLLDLPRVAVLGDARVVNRIFLGSLQDTINRAVTTDFKKPVTVDRSALGEDASLLGACSTVVGGELHFGGDMEV
ncbi:ROK family protein [Bifidobacterium favimelis]|uniref:ROK family protein n=1 Tax=Bifidobacterium favimelis TaxID=3122979 RepID=A0ABU8ZR14_9BIFI